MLSGPVREQYSAYTADPDKRLEDARLHDFICKVARASTSVDPKDLPPTSDACKYHSMWVYLQVQQWKGNAMDPLVVLGNGGQ